MNSYLEIVDDVIRLATLQPRPRLAHPTLPRQAEPRRERIARTPLQFRARGF